MCPFSDGSIDAIIFDLDGTIIDSEVFNLPAINATLADLGEPPIDLPESAYRGIRWSVIADHLRDLRPSLQGVELEETLHRHFQRLVDAEAEPVPGVINFMRSAVQRVPLAIGTSSPRESARNAMERLGLDSLIQVVVAAEDYGPSKPAPDCFLLAAERLGVKPQRCLVFEDSVAGLAAARAAAMRMVAIAHGRTALEAAELKSELTLEHFGHWPETYFSCLR